MNEYGTVHTLRSDGDIDVRFDGGWTLDCCHDDPDLLWLPPSAPRWPGDDAKRTLWGMVQWGKYDITVHHDGKASVWRWPGHGETGTLTTSKGKPLPEALLRAIREQEGIA